jgi:hypothetical protein
VNQSLRADAFRAYRAGEIKFREQIGFRDADVRCRGGELTFGAADVGPAQEQFGRQADWHLRRLRGDRRGFGQFRLQCSGLLSQQKFDAMRRGLNCAFQRRHFRARGRQHGFRLLHIQVGGEAVGEAVLRDGQGFFLRFDVLVGDGQPFLVAAQVNVIACDLTEQRHQNITLAKFGRGQLRLGRFDRAAFAAEHVNFPRRIETRLIEIVFKGT